MSDCIRVRGARENNLQGIDLDIRHGSLVAITGVSGSGKSTLAFQTLYAEGQRRYVEGFSAYARQFMARMARPRVDSVEGTPPAVALEQGTTVRTARSTVGTITGIDDFLKLLYARLATVHCDRCGGEVAPDSPSGAAARLRGTEGAFLIVAPLDLAGFDEPGALRSALLQRGLVRFLRAESRVERLDRLEAADLALGVLRVVVDRLGPARSSASRLAGSIEQAMDLAHGRCEAVGAGWALGFSRHRRCGRCGIAVPDAAAGLFSFHHPRGACPRCRGFGHLLEVDPHRVVPDPSRTLAGGAIACWRTDRRAGERRRLAAYAETHGIPMDVPWGGLTEEARRAVLDGEGRWGGVRGFFRRLERKSYRLRVRVLLARYRGQAPCTACGGARLTAEALRYRLAGLSLPESWALPVGRLRAGLAGWAATHPAVRAGGEWASVVREVDSRLGYLLDVGLDYLSLDRPARSLSGGELTRVNLTAAVGAALVETLHVLDEPSVGLHPRDTHRLVRLLRGLADVGNTVVVVEHDPQVCLASDRILDLGPGAGEAGGRVVYDGDLEGIRRSAASRTGAWLAGRERMREGRPRRPKGWIRVVGARVHNLREPAYRLPTGVLACVTGVSGSGKSSLVVDCLWGEARRLRGEEGAERAWGAVEGLETFGEVILVDASPLGRTPRANPATWSGAFDRIRARFAAGEGARALGLDARDFSFNLARGRCAACGGDGALKVEMQFLSDVWVPCEACLGTRYRGEVLEARLEGRTIAEVLAMTVEEARAFFLDDGRIQAALAPLSEAGLGYLRLGQPLSTLSGGEAQRLKLAGHLRPAASSALFLLDEPTTGLHFDDVRRLVGMLDRLVDAGHSVVVIEHHLDFIRSADHVTDLGPEGGEGGGRVVAEGTPGRVARTPGSRTGAWLRRRSVAAAQGPRRGPSRAARAVPDAIRVRGARGHNLQGVSVDIPRRRFVVVTGPSGSGKSTLAFDIVFKEGQRRYLDVLSPHARAAVQGWPRAEVESLTGLPPTLAVSQGSAQGGWRSTVATLTEVHPLLRLLFARLGAQHCPRCELPVEGSDPGSIGARLAADFAGLPLVVAAPVVRGRKGEHREVLERARRGGIARARIDGVLRGLVPGESLARHRAHDIDLVVTELPAGAPPRELEQALGRALDLGGGTLLAFEPPTGPGRVYSLRRTCGGCGAAFRSCDPRDFSFNSERGWCPGCTGLGRRLDREGAPTDEPCEACGGTRLAEAPRAVRVGGLGIHQALALGAPALGAWLDGLVFEGSRSLVATPIRAELARRLSILEELGLSYLGLDRAGETLSGGEAQRVKLAAQLYAGLVGVGYVLDEPTIGLHESDHERLLGCLRRLRDQGNTVVVVEHDRRTIEAADHLIDMGPAGGRRGGRVVAQGTAAELRGRADSPTGRWLAEPPGALPDRPPPPDRFRLRVRGARRHNLKGLDLAFPLGALTCVTGVSGSGKSTLVREVLLDGLLRALAGEPPDAARADAVVGAEEIRAALEVDQAPIGRTPRSVPASYVGILDDLRRLYARIPEARARGYTASRFSFNVRGGRCETCQGQGEVRLEMSFLPEARIPCEDCEGRRFNPETLEVNFKGASMAQVLAMTVDEALPFTAAHPRVARGLQVMQDLGLGYLPLGQPSPTLSGGEAQRVKLAAELVRSRTDDGPPPVPRPGALYVLDEPTTGLSGPDAERLGAVLRGMVTRGETVVVIEHNLDFLRFADHVVDLGPVGGEGGGRVQYQGTPAGLAARADLATGRCLARLE